MWMKPLFSLQFLIFSFPFHTEMCPLLLGNLASLSITVLSLLTIEIFSAAPSCISEEDHYIESMKDILIYLKLNRFFCLFDTISIHFASCLLCLNVHVPFSSPLLSETSTFNPHLIHTFCYFYMTSILVLSSLCPSPLS